MTKISTKDTDKLYKLITHELELYELYLSEIIAQTEFINFDDDEGLTASVEEQSRITAKIDKLHKQTAPLIKAYKASANKKQPDELCLIEKAEARIRAILEESSQINKQNIKSANEKKSEYSEQIKKLSKDKKGISGYTHKLTETSDLFDKKQ